MKISHVLCVIALLCVGVAVVSAVTGKELMRARDFDEFILLQESLTVKQRVQFFKKLFKKVKSGVSKIGKTVGNTFKKLGSAAKNVVSKASSALKKGVSAIKKGVQKLGKNIVSGVKKLGDGLMKGVKAIGKGLKEAAKVAKGLCQKYCGTLSMIASFVPPIPPIGTVVKAVSIGLSVASHFSSCSGKACFSPKSLLSVGSEVLMGAVPGGKAFKTVGKLAGPIAKIAKGGNLVGKFGKLFAKGSPLAAFAKGPLGKLGQKFLGKAVSLGKKVAPKLKKIGKVAGKVQDAVQTASDVVETAQSVAGGDE